MNLLVWIIIIFGWALSISIAWADYGSMMMQMLVAAGLEIYTDDQRQADENNPKGYFESDAVKGLVTDNAWVIYLRMSGIG